MSFVIPKDSLDLVIPSLLRNAGIDGDEYKKAVCHKIIQTDDFQKIMLNHMMSNLAKELTSGNNVVNIHEWLNDTEKVMLTKMYPEYRFNFTGKFYNSHGLSKASRRCEYHWCLSQVPKGKVSKFFDFKYKDVGGNANFLTGESVHCCNPVLDVMDCKRHSERVIVRMFNPSMSATSTCENKSQNCKVSATTCLFVHSVYDMSLTDIADTMQSASAFFGVGTFIFFPELMVRDCGYFEPLRLYYKTFKRNGRKKIQFYFKDCIQPAYEHDFALYISKLHATVLVTSDKRNAYHLELTQYRSGIVFFKIFKNACARIPQGSLSKYFPFLQFPRHVVVSCWFYDVIAGSSNPIVHMKRKHIICTRDYLNKLYGVAVQASSLNFEFRRLFTYAQSYNNRICINGSDITTVREDDKLSTEELVYLVVAVYCKTYAQRFNATETIKVITSDENRVRDISSGRTSLLKILGKKFEDFCDRIVDLLCFFRKQRQLFPIDIVDSAMFMEFQTHVKEQYCNTFEPYSLIEPQEKMIEFFENHTKELPISVPEEKCLTLCNLTEEVCDLPLEKLNVASTDGLCLFSTLGWFVNMSIDEVKDVIGNSAHLDRLIPSTRSLILKLCDPKSKEWGELCIIDVFAEIHSIKFCIHSPDKNIVVTPTNYNRTEHIYYSGSHYEPMVKKNENRLPTVKILMNDGDYNSLTKQYAVMKELDDKVRTFDINVWAAARVRSDPVKSNFGWLNRSALKLREIEESLNILKRHKNFLDLGAAPGGFCQVVNSLVPGCKYYSVTLDDYIGMQVQYPTVVEVRCSEQKTDLTFVQDDCFVVVEQVHDFVGKVDMILADASANVEDSNELNNIRLLQAQLLAAKRCLAPDGDMIIKLHGLRYQETQYMLRCILFAFDNVELVKPMSSRGISAEFYLVCTGYKGFGTEELEKPVLGASFGCAFYETQLALLNIRMDAVRKLLLALSDTQFSVDMSHSDVNYFNNFRCNMGGGNKVTNKIHDVAVKAAKKFVYVWENNKVDWFNGLRYLSAKIRISNKVTKEALKKFFDFVEFNKLSLEIELENEDSCFECVDIVSWREKNVKTDSGMSELARTNLNMEREFNKIIEESTIRTAFVAEPVQRHFLWPLVKDMTKKEACYVEAAPVLEDDACDVMEINVTSDLSVKINDFARINYSSKKGIELSYVVDEQLILNKGDKIYSSGKDIRNVIEVLPSYMVANRMYDLYVPERYFLPPFCLTELDLHGLVSSGVNLHIECQRDKLTAKPMAVYSGDLKFDPERNGESTDLEVRAMQEIIEYWNLSGKFMNECFSEVYNKLLVMNVSNEMKNYMLSLDTCYGVVNSKGEMVIKPKINFDYSTYYCTHGFNRSYNSVPPSCCKLFVVSDLAKNFFDSDLYEAVKNVDLHVPKSDISMVMGVPGCGKTTYIIKHALSTDMCIFANHSGCEDYKNRGGKAKSMTVAGFLLDRRPVSGTLWIDEALMLHPGVIYLLALLSSADRVICLGDKNQIPFVSRVQGAVLHYNNLSVPVSEVLNVSYRCPGDVAAVLNCYYEQYFEKDKKFMTVNTKSPSLDLVRIKNMSDIVVSDKVKYLVFTQDEKCALAKIGIKTSASVDTLGTVSTVHEYQGHQSKHIALIRITDKSFEIYNDFRYAVVALSRHTESFTYYCLNMVKDLVSKMCVTPVDSNAHVMNMSGGAVDVIDGTYEQVNFIQFKKNCDYKKLVIRDVGYKCGENELAIYDRKTRRVMIPDLSRFSDAPVMVEPMFRSIKNFSEFLAKLSKFTTVYAEGVDRTIPMDLVETVVNIHGGIRGRLKAVDDEVVCDVAEMKLPPYDIVDHRWFQTYYDMIYGDAHEYMEHQTDYVAAFSDRVYNVQDLTISVDRDIPKLVIYDTLQPVLKTRISDRRPHTQVESMLANMKRNQNRPILTKGLPRERLGDEMFKNFVDVYFDSEGRNLVEFMAKNSPLEPEYSATAEWLSTQDLKKYVDLVVEDAIWDTPLNRYEFQIKANPKIKTDSNVVDEYQALQTIVCHSKQINLVFCPIFREIKKRLIVLIKKNFILNTDLSVEEFARTMTRRFPTDCDHKLEIDFKQFDKCQLLEMLVFECKLMKWMGVPEWLVKLWFVAHQKTLITDFRCGIKFVIWFQRKSGDAATWTMNTAGMMAYVASALRSYFDWLHERGYLVYGSFAGDDSFLLSYFPFPDANGVVTSNFGMISKFFRNYRFVYFCSKFILIDDYGYKVLPDPVKLLIKLGRRDIKNLDHLECFRVSLVDLTEPYLTDVNLQLMYAVVERYQRDIIPDLHLLLHALVRNVKEFNSLYYLKDDAKLDLQTSSTSYLTDL